MGPSLICVDLRSPEQRRSLPWAQAIDLGITPLLELRASKTPGPQASLETLSPVHQRLWLPAAQHTAAAGAAIARQWPGASPQPPLLVALGLESHAMFSGLAQQLGTGGCLLLDQGAEQASLRQLLGLLVAAPRLKATNPAIAAEWLNLLHQHWDADLDPPGGISTAHRSTELVVAALQARELVQHHRRRLQQQPSNLAWNRLQIDLQELAPLIADPAHRNAWISAGLSSAGFQHRWDQPSQAVQSMARLLELSGACTDRANTLSILRRLPPPASPPPAQPRPDGYAVHLHAYHLQEAGVILQRLSQVPHAPQELLISCPNPQACAAALQPQLQGLRNTSIRLQQHRNHGRNIGALMAAADQLHSDVLLHLHTKNTAHHDPTAFVHRWMHYLITTLLSQLPAWLPALAEGRAAAAFPIDPNRRQLSSNCEAVQTLINQHQQRHGRGFTVQLSRRDTPIYPMGMMLALRRSFLLQELKPLYASIDPAAIAEPLAVDGTPLHGFERVIPWIAALEGQPLLLLEPPNGLSR